MDDIETKNCPYTQTRSDILQGQALFRGVEQLLIREKKRKKKMRKKGKKRKKKEKGKRKKEGKKKKEGKGKKREKEKTG